MTIKEIARLAKVSPATVSKIINNKDQNIHPQTRDRVLQIVKEYNYTPYGAVKNLTQKKTFLLGVLLKNIFQLNCMLEGLLATAQKHGYQLIVLNSNGDDETELKHITALCKNNVDGVIWEPISPDSLSHARYFQAQDIQICYLNAGELVPSYQIDFVKMGYALTQKLIDCKHTNIACLLQPGTLRSDMVEEGFRKCLYDNKISYHEGMLLYAPDKDFSAKIMQHGFSGIVSSHYDNALALLEHLQRHRYRIPATCSLVSLKGESDGGTSAACISSMLIPYRDFAAHVCLELIRDCEKTGNGSGDYIFSSDCELDGEDTLDTPPSFRLKSLVVVGSINKDLTFNVNLLPQTGKVTSILNVTTAAGGKGVNQAVGTARLGRRVSLIGFVGNDTNSSMILDMLEQEKVETQGIARDMDVQTGKAYVYIEENGESAISVLSGANASLSARAVFSQRHLFKNAGYCLLSTEIPMQAVVEAARIARAYGAKSILKPATIKSVPQELLQYIDIFVPNRKEAAALSPAGLSLEEQAEHFFAKGIPTVIITLGHEGCYLKTESCARFFPAADCMSVDSTGGADAFISALASYLVEGYSIEQTIRIATYAAGLCVTRQGVVSALPDRSTLESFIRKFEPKLI